MNWTPTMRAYRRLPVDVIAQLLPADDITAWQMWCYVRKWRAA